MSMRMGWATGALMAVLGLSVLPVGAEKGSSSATTKTTPTPGEIDRVVPPAGGKVRLPQLDFYPLRIERTRVDGEDYWVRVAFQCQSNVPLRTSVNLRVSPAATGYPQDSEGQDNFTCGAGQSRREFRCHGSQEYKATLDPANVQKETNEDNNSCTFSSASFRVSTQFQCPTAR